MHGLLSLQEDLQQHLLLGSQTIRSAIRPGGIGIDKRLAIYHHAYRMRLVDTLRDSFGHTLLYIGDDHFNAAALAYIEGHPSQHASLRWYGGDFASSLAIRFDAAPEIAELAQLDWALRHAFDGPDAPLIALADLAAITPHSWAHVGFSLHPTYAQLQLQHNTLAIWQALDQNSAPPEAMPLPEPGQVLVWRRGHQPHFRSLQALEAAALVGLQQGLGFAALCASLSAQFESQQLAAEIGSLLRRWVEEELLSQVTGLAP